MSVRLAIVVAVAVVALAFAAEALAEDPPTQVLPADGASFTAQPGQITLEASTDASPSLMDFYISKDTQVDSNGVLANWFDHFRGGPTSGDPTLYAGAPSADVLWPTTPGTYYWQAVYFDCTTGGPDCFNQSSIRTLTITPLSPYTPGANAPNTFLTHHPRHRTHKRKVTFTFRSNVAGASFRCLYAAGWANCRSPHIFRHLKPGRYRFEAQAVVNGVEDPTPASWIFKVLR